MIGLEERMLSVEQALLAVLDHAQALPFRVVAIREALGCILGETIRADRDSPPFDKSLVDGFALRSAEAASEGPHWFRVGEEILAGQTPSRALRPGEVASIMTGAPLPEGADAVVMHEKTERRGESVLIPGPVRVDEGRLRRGREMKADEPIFTPGQRLNAAALGVLASVGRTEVAVIPRPRVAIVPTGDELVVPGQTPGAGQIRESNGAVLSALVRSFGGVATIAPIAPDEPEGLQQVLSEALADCDLLFVCGGVSAGKKDLVPATLSRLGVETIFHKVRVKPGKPLLFGVGPRNQINAPKLVFGLPGNPVSGIVNVLLFVGPALRTLRGGERIQPIRDRVPLTAPFRQRGDRVSFHPVTRTNRGVEPLPWAGSADLRAIARADGFARFPEGDREYQAGDLVEFLPLDGA